MPLLINNIPSELLDQNPKEGEVYILIGENGSGKSYMLSRLTNEYIKQRKKVIGISNSIHDKFPDSRKNLFLLRDRAGRQKVKRSIKNSLLNIPVDDTQRLKSASNALRHIGYDPVIGIEKLSVTPSEFDLRISDERFSSLLDSYEVEEIRSLLYKMASFKSESIIWLGFSNFSFLEIDRSSIIQILRWESTLKRLELLNSINLFLRKDEVTIPLYDASSGELSFVSTIIFLATTINEETAILIDEPENSLHPKWQKDYIKILLELFYLYQPKIVVATHSALIVTGSEITNPSTIVFECFKFQFTKRTYEPINIEEAFINYFNVVTPQNRYLSNLIITMLNRLAEGEMTIDNLNIRIDELERESYQPDQAKMLNGVKEIAQKIITNRNNLTQH